METSPHLLIVDDDREIRDLLSRFLAKHGYRVSTAKDAREARRILADARIDLGILDIMMPGEDGLSLCRDLRANSALPLIMLTAMGEETDRIVGLEVGADDYLPKPFNPRELLARIKAVLRRSGPALAEKEEKNENLQFAGWTLDTAQRRLTTPGGEAVELSTGEYDLLLAFLRHPQRVLNRDQLLDLARGRAAIPFDRSIDVQVMRLRRKIEADPKAPKIIATVRGGGYQFTPAVQKS
ncbi:MAG TPA: response regulator [Verrucomicrobiae bacterium]|nr:response regulator [Verrucomicrobiae bacterium]